MCPTVNKTKFVFHQFLYARTPNNSPKHAKSYPWILRCMGTDLNRNWGFHWNDGGSSSDPCSQVYHGDGPFSEVENRNVRDFVWAHKVGCIRFNV